MLISTMSNLEVTKEIDRDYKLIISSSTLWRLKAEYHKERTRLKIKKEEDYPVFKTFKTKAKNVWLVRISKRRTKATYRDTEDQELTVFTYYYSKIGFRFFYSPFLVPLNSLS